MSDAKPIRTDPGKSFPEKMQDLKSTAIAALERQGYEVRGKTTTQIRRILRRHPTKPPSIPQ
jgi:hypothetical protein